MIRMNKVVCTTCLTVTLLAGCVPVSTNEPVSEATEDPSYIEESSQEPSQASTIEESNTDNNKELNFLQRLSKFIERKPSAIEIAAFMNDELHDSAKDEADIAISRLILAQESLANNWNNMMFDGRIKGFQEMEYQWHPENIEKIQNSSIKEAYQNLVDSRCRVVTYEETPVVETDWASMQDYKDNLSVAAMLMIDINCKMQNYDYGASPHNFSEMIQDLLKLEKALKYRQSDYMAHLMNKTYNQLIGEIFYSVEGMNMEYWNAPDGPLHAALRDVITSQPHSNIAQLGNQFLRSEISLRGSDDYFNTLTALVSGHNPFGLQSAMRFNQVIEINDNVKTTIDYLYCPQKSAVEERINESIDLGLKDVKEKLNWGPNHKEVLNIYSYSTFTSTKYFSTTLFASYTDHNGAFKYTDHHMMFDLKTGKQLRLEDFIEKTSSYNETFLLQLIKERYTKDHTYFNDLDSLPSPLEYQIDDYGLSIFFEAEEISPDYHQPFTAYMAHGELTALYDVIQLYE